MLVEVVNEEKGYGYDEDGDPVIRVGGVWREVTGGWISGGNLHVEYPAGRSKSYQTISLTKAPS